MSILTRVLAAIAIVAFSAGPLSAAAATNASSLVAQATTGGVSGTAVDESGAPIANASVAMIGPTSFSTTTDAKGAFSIANIPAGVYSITVRRVGYDTATQLDFPIFSGEIEKVAVTMHTATLTTLQTIATVRTVGRGSFNTSTASVQSLSAQTYADQGQTQVAHVLNEVPGVQISLPNNSANDAVPGAITFPNIRNGLSFETATLIDGHPLSVGLYGDYVTTFLNPAVFGATDIIKGPGAMAPQVNYAIGGTINFRTKDPTATVTPTYSFGLSSHGGSFYDFGVSDTLGRLGFVAEIAGESDPSALNGQSFYYDPGVGNVTILNGKELFDSPAKNTVPGTASQLSDGYHAIACCARLYGSYNDQTVLLKGRFKFSSATTFTGSYLGSIAYANQTGNTSELGAAASFSPGGGYSNVSGAPAVGPVTALYSYYATGGQGENEINNEPILQGEIATTLGEDTVLARYYHATINRQKLGSGSPLNPTSMSIPIWGTVSGFATPFEGQNQTVQVYDYYDNPETDRLAGLSFQYDHPINQGNGDVAFSIDRTNSQTVVTSSSDSYNYNGQQCPYNEAATICPNTSVSLPSGANQVFTTYLLRLRDQIGSKLNATLSLYQNIYQNTFPTDCANSTSSTATTVTSTVCLANGTLDKTVYTKATKLTTITNSPVNFMTNTPTHFDPRLGLEYRLDRNTALRLAAGSSIAPPYINLLSSAAGIVSYNTAQGIAYQNLNAGSFLKPETAAGVDVGIDHRLKDNVTVISADVYQTNLFNQFIKQTYNSGLTCASTGVVCPGAAAGNAAIPLYYSSNVNLSNARYEGIELSIHHTPATGFGYVVQGSAQRGYAYNLGPCFYSTVGVSPKNPTCNQGTNLAIISGQNYTGGGIGFNGVSNQSVPYFQGNAEINYTAKNGMYLAFGDTLYGKNNSLNEPAFGLAYATLRYPFSHSFALQISGDNIFNAYPGVIPVYGGGVPVPLAAAPAPGLPAQGGTLGNVNGPATWRFELTKNIGPEPVAGASANP